MRIRERKRDGLRHEVRESYWEMEGTETAGRMEREREKEVLESERRDGGNNRSDGWTEGVCLWLLKAKRENGLSFTFIFFHPQACLCHTFTPFDFHGWSAKQSMPTGWWCLATERKLHLVCAKVMLGWDRTSLVPNRIKNLESDISCCPSFLRLPGCNVLFWCDILYHHHYDYIYYS